MKPVPAIERDIYIPGSDVQRHRLPVFHKQIKSRPLLSHAQIAFLLLLLAQISTFGSTVDIWFSTTGIVAGADSLERQESAAGTTEVMICKIQPVGKFYIAATGYEGIFTEDRPSKVIFSAVETARSVATRDSRLEDLMSNFISSAEPQLQAAMLLLLKMKPTFFMSEINGKGGVLAISIFGVINDEPELAFVSFTAMASGLSDVRIEHTPPTFCPSAVCDLRRSDPILRLGSRDTSVPIPFPSTTDEAVPWVAGIIEAEIVEDEEMSQREKRPRKVAGSISVLVLTRSVTRWPDGYHETCPAQEQQ